MICKEQTLFSDRIKPFENEYFCVFLVSLSWERSKQFYNKTDKPY